MRRIRMPKACQSIVILVRPLVAWWLLQVLVACASQQRSEPTQASFDSMAQFAAKDLIFALVQVFPPEVTTIQMGPTPTTFGQNLVQEITQAGYGLQRVTADQGTRYLNFLEVRPNRFRDYPNYRFLISIGAIGFEREYTFDGNAFADHAKIIPAKPLRAYGTDKPIQPHPTLFESENIDSKINTIGHDKDNQATTAPNIKGFALYSRSAHKQR